jgi:two-component system response regulator (stage 0 sporulation protein F)
LELLSNNYLLVVDDNRGICLLLNDFLTQEAFIVKYASNGLEALQLVMEEKPSLVLLDLRMPGLSGLETLIKLKDLAPDTIVIIMSAYFDQKDVQEWVKEGIIEHYIVKPFDLIALRSLINELLSNDNKKCI